MLTNKNYIPLGVYIAALIIQILTSKFQFAVNDDLGIWLTLAGGWHESVTPDYLFPISGTLKSLFAFVDKQFILQGYTALLFVPFAVLVCLVGYLVFRAEILSAWLFVIFSSITIFPLLHKVSYTHSAIIAYVCISVFIAFFWDFNADPTRNFEKKKGFSSRKLLCVLNCFGRPSNLFIISVIIALSIIGFVIRPNTNTVALIILGYAFLLHPTIWRSKGIQFPVNIAFSVIFVIIFSFSIFVLFPYWDGKIYPSLSDEQVIGESARALFVHDYVWPCNPEQFKGALELIGLSKLEFEILRSWIPVPSEYYSHEWFTKTMQKLGKVELNSGCDFSNMKNYQGLGLLFSLVFCGLFSIFSDKNRLEKVLSLVGLGLFFSAVIVASFSFRPVPFRVLGPMSIGLILILIPTFSQAIRFCTATCTESRKKIVLHIKFFFAISSVLNKIWSKYIFTRQTQRDGLPYLFSQLPILKTNNLNERMIGGITATDLGQEKRSMPTNIFKFFRICFLTLTFCFVANFFNVTENIHDYFKTFTDKTHYPKQKRLDSIYCHKFRDVFEAQGSNDALLFLDPDIIPHHCFSSPFVSKAPLRVLNNAIPFGWLYLDPEVQAFLEPFGGFEGYFCEEPSTLLISDYKAVRLEKYFESKGKSLNIERSQFFVKATCQS